MNFKYVFVIEYYMSSYIQVYGQNKDSRNWLRENYSSADKAFKKIHSPYRDDESANDVHGLLVHENPRSNGIFNYSWHVPCHQDSGEHFQQTRKDIQKILRELGRSKYSIKLYLSPMSD